MLFSFLKNPNAVFQHYKNSELPPNTVAPSPPLKKETLVTLPYDSPKENTRAE
jgi:hypothetical protein